MFEDDFGRFWNLPTRCKWTMLILECNGEFKHVEFTQHGDEKFEKNVYFLCMPLLSFQQKKTKLCMLHVQVNVAGQTACFLCVSCVEKGTESIAVKPS